MVGAMRATDPRSGGMPEQLTPAEKAKAAAARRAVDYVEDGMRLGLGTGSTAAWMVRALGRRVREEGLRVRGVPTSERTAELAREVGVPLATLDELRWLDLAIDGTDEHDDALNLVKGGGGALLREKIVAAASDVMVVVADEGKRVDTLGAFPLPVEVVPFGWPATQAMIEESLIGLDVDGRSASLRMEGDEPYRTDGGNLILDLHLGRIGDPPRLAGELARIPGVIETGLFLGICDVVVSGSADGTVTLREASGGGIRSERVDMGEGDNIFGEVRD
jgi:ribose 5-phosphate isomerase A